MITDEGRSLDKRPWASLRSFTVRVPISSLNSPYKKEVITALHYNFQYFWRYLLSAMLSYFVVSETENVDCHVATAKDICRSNDTKRQSREIPLNCNSLLIWINKIILRRLLYSKLRQVFIRNTFSSVIIIFCRDYSFRLPTDIG